MDIEEFDNDELIDELASRRLSRFELDQLEAFLTEELTLEVFETEDLLEELQTRGLAIPPIENLDDEQKLELIMKNFNKYTYVELEALYTKNKKK